MLNCANWRLRQMANGENPTHFSLMPGERARLKSRGHSRRPAKAKLPWNDRQMQLKNTFCVRENANVAARQHSICLFKQTESVVHAHGYCLEMHHADRVI